MLEPVRRAASIKLLFGHDMPAAGRDDWTTQSDHGAFHSAGIPFLYFGVEDHPDYHKPTDTADKINPSSSIQAAATILDAVTRVDRALPPPREVTRAARVTSRALDLRSAARRAVRAVQRRAVGHRSDSDRPPLHARRTIAKSSAFCAAALAFGRVQSVLNSIEGLLQVMGPSPAAFVRAFEPARDRRALDHLVHRWTRGIDLAALVWMLRQMLDSHGSIEAFFVDGADPAAETIEEALDAFSRRACALDRTPVYGRTRPQAGRGATSSPGRRAAARASGSTCSCAGWSGAIGVDLGVWTTRDAGAAHRPARYPCHPRSAAACG